MSKTQSAHRLTVALCLTALLLSGAALVLPQPSAGQTRQEFGSAKEAIATLAQFPGAIRQKVSDASQATFRLGRGIIGFDCCAEKFLWWCTREYHAAFNTHIPEPHSHLGEALKQAVRHSETLPVSFKPVNDWFQQTLPRFNTSFAEASARILAIADEISAGEGPTAEQRREVASLLDGLSTSLEQGSEKLKTGLGVLATFQQKLVAIQQEITEANKYLEAEAQQAIDGLHAIINKQPCGQDQARSELGGIQREFNNAVNTSTAALSALEELTNDADNALSLLMGTVINFVAHYEQVSDEVEQAQSAELGSVIQELHLDVARAAWDDLAAYATAQMR